MYLSKVVIKNFKAIETLELELKPGFNMVIGDNGVGKSSVLEAIAVALGGFIKGIDGVPTRNIAMDDVRFVFRTAGDASSHIEYSTPVEIDATLNLTEDERKKLSLKRFEYSWTRSKSTHDPNAKTTTNPKDICKFAQKLANNFNAMLPLISYQSAARTWQQKRGDSGNVIQKKLNDRRCAYIGCLDFATDAKSIETWCLKMEMTAYQKKSDIVEYEAFKRIVSKMMKYMDESPELPELRYDSQYNKILYLYNGKTMPIENLSAGYQSILWMTMDFAYRLALLNPELGYDIDKVYGIAVIDELDLHLHPKWQWKVIQSLTAVFPNVQFIVATHSAILLSSCKNGNIISLNEAQEVIYAPDAYAHSVNDILSLRQESNDRPKEIQVILDEYEMALDDGDVKSAHIAVDKAASILGEIHPDVITMRSELD